MITRIPETFCPQPFNYVYPNHNGSWKPCCKCVKFPSKKMSFDQWWHEDEDLYNLRKSLITGEKSKIYEETCEPCYGPEKRNSKSYRQHILENIRDNFLWLGIINNFMDTDEHIVNERYLTVKVRGFGNDCNLKCYMCIPHNSTSKNNEMMKVSDESLNLFYPNRGRERLIKNKDISTNEIEKQQLLDVIDEVGPFITRMNLSGGEPTMIQEYYDLLDELVNKNLSQNITIFMNSNLTRLKFKDKHIEYYFDKFKQFEIMASVDDIYERDEWIRYPSKFETVIKNCKYLLSQDKCKLSVNITWSLLNASNAENIMEYFEKNNIEINQNPNFVQSPAPLHPSNHPGALQLSEKYKKSKYKLVRNLGYEMARKSNELDFFKAMSYIKDLDKIRKTECWKIFPEFEEYLR